MGRAFFRSLLESGNETLAIGVFVVMGFFFYAMALGAVLFVLYLLYLLLYDILEMLSSKPMKTRVWSYLFIVAIGVFIYTVVPTTFWVGLGHFITFPFSLAQEVF